MSLFKWSTPERRRVDQILPIIPNEIYIYIFEFAAPPTGRLTTEEFAIFSHLSRVCRFFANVCLPRLFEFLEFCGYPIPSNNASRVASVTLWKQIAANQPLALSLAKRVRSCHFTSRLHHNRPGIPIVNKYLAGIVLHMKNIRELMFSNIDFVRAKHWSAIATLESLEALSFESCFVKLDPADVYPEDRVKVSRFRVTDCKVHPLVTAIHPQYLRVLAVDISFFNHVDWLLQTGLIEVHLYINRPCSLRSCQGWMHTFLTQAPQSLETLTLFIDVCILTVVHRDIVRSMFADPAWKKLSALRSLTLLRHYYNPKLSFIMDCISLLADLETFTLKGLSWDVIESVISPAEVQCILHDKLGPSSSLTYVDIYGKVFCLVDGEWSDASCSTM